MGKGTCEQHVLTDSFMDSSSKSSLLHLIAVYNITCFVLFGPYPLVLVVCSWVFCYLWNIFGCHTYCRYSEYFHMGPVHMASHCIPWICLILCCWWCCYWACFVGSSCVPFFPKAMWGYLHLVRTSLRICCSVLRSSSGEQTDSALCANVLIALYFATM